MKKRQPIRADTADEAIEKMLEQKRISSKINYDVLKDLNVKPGASPRHKVETPKREPRITGRGVRTAACPLGVSKQVTLLGKRWVRFRFDAFGRVLSAVSVWKANYQQSKPSCQQISTAASMPLAVLEVSKACFGF